GLAGTDLYDAGMQDRLACFLLGRRGIDRYLAGEINQAEIVNALAREWASLPSATGHGLYAGQKTGVSLGEMSAALAEMRRRANAGLPSSGWFCLPEWLADWLRGWGRAGTAVKTAGKG